MGARRREPSLTRNARGERGADLRVGPEDRIDGGPKLGPRDRKEPFLNSAPLRRDDEDFVMARGRGRTDSDESRDQDERPSRRSGGRGKTPRRSIPGLLFYWACVCGVWALVAVGGLIAYHAAQLPPIDKLAVPKRPPNIAIMGDDGKLLANRGDTGGAAISLRDLPAYVPKAFIAIEDRRFYHHWGIDPVGVAHALVRNASGRGAMQGGSTLTQQLAKNLFLTQERTLSRKVQEAILAFWLERKYSKDQILELYLNRVYFGAGAYGVEAAARRYFGHGARETTLPEAAMLAGLMKAPTKLAPNKNPAAAADRASQVITAMAQEGMITDRMAALAIMRPAAVSRDTAGSINYAADFVMDVLDETVGAIDEDIVVSTTLSPDKQFLAEKALTDELDASGKRFGVQQGAVVSIDPNGQIKALIGGRNYAESSFNRAVSARRQPGSSFKPFVYLAALERGLTPDTIRDDAPINVRGWQPQNSTQNFQGQVTLTRALALSLNTVAVRLGLEVGPKAVVATAHRLGVASDLQANASIALGTSEVTPLELVSAYAPFANGGIRVQPHIITRVRTAKGKLLYQRKGASFGRVIEPAQVGMMNQMLQETLTIGTGRHAELPGWQAAGKTGTSQDYRDAWFVGYTSQLVTGVWLGNDDNSPTRKTSGGNLPVNIWSKYMRAALQGTPPTPLPGTLRSYDPGSNLPPANVGATGPMARRDPIGDMIAPPRERNFFEKLFGG